MWQSWIAPSVAISLLAIRAIHSAMIRLFANAAKHIMPTLAEAFFCATSKTECHEKPNCDSFEFHAQDSNLSNPSAVLASDRKL